MKEIKNLLKMLLVPLATYLVFWLLCNLRGVSNFGQGVDLIVILRNTCYASLIALAVSYNLTAGRFDFAVGATLLLSTAIGGLLTIQLGRGPVFMLVVSLVFGAVVGFISGAVYCITRLPAMVVSLGLAMIYEAVAFKLTSGNGVSFLSNKDLLIWAKQPYVSVFVAIIVAVLYIVLNKTKFGYNTRSLTNGQEISVNAGIDEKKNTIGCYVIAGVCLAGAGVINMCVLGNVELKLGLASQQYIANAFLPMFIGNLLAKYCDRNTGVVVGALTQAILYSGIGKLGINTAWQQAISGLITIVFFAYMCNAYKLEEMKLFRAKKEKALAAQKKQIV